MIKSEDAAKIMKVLLNEEARWERSAALQLAVKVKCVKLLIGCEADVDEIVIKVKK